MHKVVCFLPVFFLLASESLFAKYSLQDAMLEVQDDLKREMVISKVESLYDEATDKDERGRISYFLTLNPEYKTKRAQNYYLKAALKYKTNLSQKEIFRLNRTLADLEFKTGQLESALKYYEIALSLKKESKLKDYLNLQKFWVLVNLGREVEALNGLESFILTNNSQMHDILVQDYAKVWSESLIKHKDIPNFKNIDKWLLFSDSLLSGIFSGYVREMGSREARDLITKGLVANSLYDRFFNYGIRKQKFPGDINCAFLVWKLPNTIDDDLIKGVLHSAYQCLETFPEEVKRLYSYIKEREVLSVELALLGEKVDSAKGCDTYRNLISKKVNLDVAFKNYALTCINSPYDREVLQNLFQNRDLKISMDILKSGQFNKLLMETMIKEEIKDKDFLSQLLVGYFFKKENEKKSFYSLFEANQKVISENKGEFIYPYFLKLSVDNESAIVEELNILNENFLKLDRDARVNILKILMRDLRNNELNRDSFVSLLTQDPSLLNEGGIYSVLLLDNDLLKRLRSLNFKDQGLDYFSGKVNYFSYSSYRKMGKLVSKEVKANLYIFRSIFDLRGVSNKLNTIARQDDFFFKLEALNKKLGHVKWQSEDLRTKAFESYINLLDKSIHNIKKHRTEISSKLVEVLDIFLLKAKKVVKVSTV